jgi:guanylate kinase
MGSLFVLSGPSGVGKTTLRKLLLARTPGLCYSVSATTRPPRPGEIHGRDYYFLSRGQFERLVRQGEFLEWAWVFGHSYGTLKREVLTRLRHGYDVLLEIDVQGAAQIRRRARTLSAPVYFLFVLPPSLRALEERLARRGTEPPAALRRRVQGALEELQEAPKFDHLTVNGDLEGALSALERFIWAARRWALSDAQGSIARG